MSYWSHLYSEHVTAGSTFNMHNGPFRLKQTLWATGIFRVYVHLSPSGRLVVRMRLAGREVYRIPRAKPTSHTFTIAPFDGIFQA